MVKMPAYSGQETHYFMGLTPKEFDFTCYFKGLRASELFLLCERPQLEEVAAALEIANYPSMAKLDLAMAIREKLNGDG